MKQIRILIIATLVVLTLSVTAQEKTIDLSKSTLKWTGKKVTGEHYGYIKLKSGKLVVDTKKITSGTFIIDMATINNKDLEDPEWNKKLIDHLNSDDFFSTKKYPEAKLVIKGSTDFTDNIAKVKADLTIKGKTHPVAFDVKKNGSVYVAIILVDRTLYDIRYGSGKFFESLGDNMIYDEFELDVKISLK